MLSILITIVIQTVVPQYTMDFAKQVAERLNGEGAISVSIEADNPDAFNYSVCTVRSRLDRGWTTNKVLNPFYAPDVPVEDIGYILKAYNILNRISLFNCQDVYFVFSHQDILYLQFDFNDMTSRIYSSPTIGLNFMTVEAYRLQN